MEKGQLWRQFVIAGFGNVALASIGYSMGWTSPIMQKLTNDTGNPLGRPVTLDEAAWIGSILNVGGIFGPFFGGLTASAIGRKWGLMSACVPLFVGWGLITAASSVGCIIAARFFWGLAAGMLFTLMPMYSAEIATDNSRGALGTFLQLSTSLGFLLVYAIGPFVTYAVVAYVGLGVVTVSAVAFFFMPESPVYHLTKGDRESAAKCLATIRGRSLEGVDDELSIMHEEVQASMKNTATMGDLFRGSNFKAFYISCALVFFQQFSGINAVLFYMTNIFDAAGTSIDPNIATIIIGSVSVTASSMTPFVVDRLGRRPLMLISCSGTAIGLSFLGVYFMLDSMGHPIAQSIRFLPILCLVLFIVSHCWGLGPIPWAVMGELFPVEVKALTQPIATACCWSVSFIVTRFFGPIAESVGMYFAFWFFAACCILGFLFTWFLVPETRGKSIREIQDMLAGRYDEQSTKQKA